MVRVLVEISLPASTISRVEASLHPDVLPPGVTGRLQAVRRSGGCESPALGGEASWTPCWISVESPGPAGAHFAAAVRHLKEVLVRAAGEGGLRLFVVPANAQIADAYRRFPDLLDVLDELPQAR